jgi:cytochrome c peroxidase
MRVIFLPCILVLSTLPGFSSGSAEEAPVDLGALKANYARETIVPEPPANPVTPPKAALGKMLFFDPRLSASGSISCASCHNPGLGWGDGLAKGFGNLGIPMTRHTPTILDVAFGEPYFGDGRSPDLEDQAKGPLMSAKEMDMTAESAVGLLKSLPGYVAAFAQAYPGEAISLDTIAKAIASFERTVISADAPFDRWIRGDDQAISPAAVRGFQVFNAKGQCAACHMTWRMSDDGFHDIGLKDSDRGRAAIMPGIVQLEHAFKTPTLRNINQRAPYMHDGSLATLSEVIEHYDHGFEQRASLDPAMKSLQLTPGEKRDLLAFLDTLTSPDGPVVLAVLPR